MFIAREKNGLLRLYTEKPLRSYEYWYLTDQSNCLTIDSNLFPDLTWEDEPREIFLNTGYDMANQLNHVWAMLKVTQEELNKSNQELMYYRTKFNDLKNIINEE